MKMKKNLATLLLLGIIFPIGMVNAQNSPSQWKGTVETKEGITVVKNAGIPAFGLMEINVESDLNLEFGRDEEDVFGEIIKVEVDKNENIYILDEKRLLITSFDKNGKFRLQFGSRGAGPGEFDSVRDIFIGDNGNINVLTSRSIVIFNSTGESLHHIKLNSYTFDFFINEKNQYIVSYYAYDQGVFNRDMVLGYSTAELKIDKEIDRYRLDKLVKRKAGERMMVFNIAHEYQPLFYFARKQNNACVFGLSSDYRLKIADEKGNIVKIIENSVKGVGITGKEKKIIHDKLAPRCEDWPKDVFEETLQFPDQRPFFNKILVDDIGRIFVQRITGVNKDDSEKKEPFIFDIYDPEGHFVYRAQFPVNPDLIKKGKLYHIDTSEEDDDVTVKRYKISNWNQLKTSISN